MLSADKLGKEFGPGSGPTSLIRVQTVPTIKLTRKIRELQLAVYTKSFNMKRVRTEV